MAGPLARSYLFVPGDRPERFDKAVASGADAVVLDLEDAVAPEAKPAAREAVAAWLRAGPPGAATAVVRINDPSTPWFDDDVAMLAAVGARAAMWPKAEAAEALAKCHAALPGLALLPLIESARGVLAVEAVAAAPGVQRLVFGTVDFALDLDLAGPLATTVGLDHAAARIALASRALGLAAPVAGVTVALDDPAVLQADLDRARAHGFGAKLCIHPRQVAAVHAALAPDPAELAFAQRVLALVDGTPGGIAGAVRLDGRMVDKPVIERARRLVQRAARP